MRLASLLVILSAAGCSAHVDPDPPDPPARTATPGISEAIAALGDDDFTVRDAAAERLLAAGRESLPYLDAARSSDDPEVRVRAQALTSAIEEAPLVWVGTRDDRWENPENWEPKSLPRAYSTAIVPQCVSPLSPPVIRDDVDVRNLVLLKGAELTVVETAHLRVTGRLRVRGVMKAQGTVEAAQ